MKKILWIWMAVFLGGCASMAPKPETGAFPDGLPKAKIVKPRALREFVFHAWSLSLSEPEGRKLLLELKSHAAGKQSRDLHGKLLEFAERKIIKRHPAPLFYHFELHDADFKKMGGEVFWKNGTLHKIPEDFGPGSAFELTVYGTGTPNRPDGSLAVEIRPSWNTPRIAATIHSKIPDALRYYPDSGSLKTCGPATAKVCGGPYNPSRPTALFEWLNSAGITHFHFVVR
ncbi:MAG: hypothetical protein Q8Q97_01270 [bacterium]|nr:hypothetical protein [bacterium]